MISGATYTLPLNISYPLQNTEKIIITLKNEATGIKRTKHYPNNEETWMMADGRIGVRLTQQDTIDLVGYVKIEAQINLKSGAVAKTKTERTYIASTLNTEIVEGAMDDGETYLEGVTMEMGDPVVPINIFAADENAVHYTHEEKTEEEKERARDNIGAVGEDDVHNIMKEKIESGGMAHIHKNGITGAEGTTLKARTYEDRSEISIKGTTLTGRIYGGQIIEIGASESYYMVTEDTGDAQLEEVAGDEYYTINNIKLDRAIGKVFAAGTSVGIFEAVKYL